MGFLRFRRSIKILPGVRWNIGKKSTSLSIGPRGAHYTVGTAGTRTTVGLPGTGLSYTDIHKTHTKVTQDTDSGNIPMPDPAWVAAQQGKATIHIPDRGNDEPPIRPDQIEELNKLGHAGTTGFDPKTLGSDQAANVILQLKEAQREYSKNTEHGHAVSDDFIDHAYDHPDEPYTPVKKGAGLRTILVILFLIWVFMQLIGSCSK